MVGVQGDCGLRAFGRRMFQALWKPARSIPRWASGLFMKVSHTNPVRRFSAINRTIPVSIPITSVSYQFFRGLKALTNPYLLHAEGYLLRIFFNTRSAGPGRNGSEPRAALGTTVPSIGPVAGGPPQTTYPSGWESDAVMPHRSSL